MIYCCERCERVRLQRACDNLRRAIKELTEASGAVWNNHRVVAIGWAPRQAIIDTYPDERCELVRLKRACDNLRQAFSQYTVARFAASDQRIRRLNIGNGLKPNL